MPPPIKPSIFEVFARMCERNDSALVMGPLSNIIGAQLVHKGKDTHITMGMPGDFVQGILREKYLGGLFLCDRKRFEEVREEMRKEQIASGQGPIPREPA